MHDVTSASQTTSGWRLCTALAQPCGISKQIEIKSTNPKASATYTSRSTRPLYNLLIMFINDESEVEYKINREFGGKWNNSYNQVQGYTVIYPCQCQFRGETKHQCGDLLCSPSPSTIAITNQKALLTVSSLSLTHSN